MTALDAGLAVCMNGGTMPSNYLNSTLELEAGSYDTMTLANALQTLLELGSIAVMIPALWITTKIVRDRPFSSYSSDHRQWTALCLRCFS